MRTGKATIFYIFLLVSVLLSGCRDGTPDGGGVPKPSISSPDAIPATGAFGAPAHTPIATSAVAAIPEEPPASVPAQDAPSTAEPSVPDDSELVRVSDYIPDIAVDLKYATKDNFVGSVIYSFTDAWLRYGTVKKLMAAQGELSELGFSLKIWDAFRPVSAQYTLWEAVPDPQYVADPNKGFSSHSRGNAVDVTLVDGQGNELEMPTGFDDFSSYADRDYSDASNTAAENAELLENAMINAGFSAYHAEWWHYSDTVSYPPDSVFSP